MTTTAETRDRASPAEPLWTLSRTRTDAISCNVIFDSHVAIFPAHGGSVGGLLLLAHLGRTRLGWSGKPTWPKSW
jgi:hypothetical protein